MHKKSISTDELVIKRNELMAKISLKEKEIEQMKEEKAHIDYVLHNLMGKIIDSSYSQHIPDNLKTTRELALEIISNSIRPLSIAEIYEALEKRSIRISRSALDSALSRLVSNGLIARVGEGLYRYR